MAAKNQSMAQAESGSLILQGVLAILFGIAAVFWPGLTTATLVYLFAGFLIIDAVIVMVMGLMQLRHFGKALLLILLGLLELGVGLYLFRNPAVTFATLILILGFSLIVRGVFDFIHAFTQKTLATTRVMHAILGILGVVVGIIILNQPVTGGLAFVWLLGLYALITGPVMIAMSSDISKGKQ